MRKKLIAISLAFFLIFSIVSSEYYSVKANAAATGAAVAVAGGGFAAGAAALLPVIAVVGLCALGGYGIYSYVSANAAEQGMTNTEYMQGVFEDFCESTGQSTAVQANAMMNDVTVMQDGTIGITNAASGVWHDFLDWMATSAGAGELAAYASADAIDEGGAYTGTPEIVNGKYQYSGSGVYYEPGLSTHYVKVTAQPTDYLVAAYYCEESWGDIGYKFAKKYGNDITGAFFPRYLATSADGPYERNSSTGMFATSNTTKTIYTVISPDFNFPIFQTKAECRAYLLNDAHDDAAAINKVSDHTGAFIGDFSGMTGAATYQGMDVLTGDQTFVLNPDITDAIAKALEGVISRALTLDIPTYFNLVMDVINGAPTISIPYENTFIDIAAPTFAPVDNSITNNIDITEGTTVINITKPIVDDAIDIPTVSIGEIADELNPIVEWGLNYVSPQKGLLSKFPFSIAYDLYLLIAALSGSSQDAVNANPKELSITNDLNAPGASYVENMNSAFVFNLTFQVPDGQGGKIATPVTVDLSQYEWFFRVIRYATGILWLVGLLNWARKETN